MFESVATGMPYGAIARDLNRRGYTAMLGGRFNATAVRRTVSNPAYVGTIVVGHSRQA